MNGFGRVEPADWTDEEAYCVGGGPSLWHFDFDRLREKRHVVAVNQALFDCPCACGISVDHVFVQHNVERLRDFARGRTLYLCVGNEWWKGGLPMVEGAIYLRSQPRIGPLAGLSFDPAFLHRAPTSGYAALNVAVLKGAKRIYLLGYDYAVAGSRHHYHDEYSWHHPAQDQSWSVWSRHYERAARDCLEHGIEVINASPKSALPYFRRVPIEDLAWTG